MGENISFLYLRNCRVVVIIIVVPGSVTESCRVVLCLVDDDGDGDDGDDDDGGDDDDDGDADGDDDP